MEESNANVKALTAMFSEIKEPIMGIKVTDNVKKTPPVAMPRQSQNSQSKPAIKPKPPIKSQKPVLPKAQPKKPPRLKNGDQNFRKSVESLEKVNDEEEGSVQSKSDQSEIENFSDTKSPRVSSIRSQSFDSLNTVYTSDSGISSNLRLDSSTEKNSSSNNLFSASNDNFNGRVNMTSNNSFKMELEKRLGSNTSLKSSDGSSVHSLDSHKLPHYRRKRLSELDVKDVPPRKPMLPPDVHIAVFKEIVDDKPPPAPPRRNSKTLDETDAKPSSKSYKMNECNENKIVPRSRLVPTRPSPPPPKIKSMTAVSPSHSELSDESINGNKTLDKRVSFIPEYTEEEELADQLLYDDTGLNSDAPPPLPSKPFNAYSKGLNDDYAHYQTPIIQVLPPENLNQTTRRESQNKTRKEQKELEKKEKEIAKAKKKYSLTGDETILDYGIIKESSKGWRNGLSVKKGEQVLILRMENNPPGMWLVKNSIDKLGYVELTNIEVMLSSSPGKYPDNNFNIEEDNYDEIDTNCDESIYEETY